MRIGTPHEIALVLEHLHPTPAPAELSHLLCPGIDDRADFGNGHFRQRQIMARRKTDDTTGPRLDMCLK